MQFGFIEHVVPFDGSGRFNPTLNPILGKRPRSLSLCIRRLVATETDTPPIFLSCTISRRISMTRDEWHSSLGRECHGDATKSKPKLERIQAVLEGPSASRRPGCELYLNPKTFQHLSGYGQSQL